MTDQTKRIKGQNILYTGKYFEVFDQLVEYFEDGVSKDYFIETVRRPPSIRSLIVDFKAPIQQLGKTRDWTVPSYNSSKLLTYEQVNGHKENKQISTVC